MCRGASAFWACREDIEQIAYFAAAATLQLQLKSCCVASHCRKRLNWVDAMPDGLC